MYDLEARVIGTFFLRGVRSNRIGSDAAKLAGIPIAITNDGGLEAVVFDFIIERSLGS